MVLDGKGNTPGKLPSGLLALCRAARGRDRDAIAFMADLLAETGDAALTAAAIRCVLGMDDQEGRSLAGLLRAHGAGTRVGKVVWHLAQKLNLQPAQVTVEDLTAQTPADLLDFPNFGPTSLHEVRRILAQYGLRLRDD
jgi:hypothetical protein